ncbi:MAG: DUF1538 domain-containing protein, partial [Clostridiales bacterium]
SRKLVVIIFGTLLLGVIITISEPDLQVLANQVPAIPNIILILAVAIGVGLFLIVAMLRMLFQIKLNTLLLLFYGMVFILAIFVPTDFLAVAFDSGGVTTGPMTVPFIMALGVGAAAIRSDKAAKDDSFGLVALCSVGPILAVMLLGLLYTPGESVFAEVAIPHYADSREVWLQFVSGFPIYIKDVLLALSPIIICFYLYQVLMLHLPKRNLIKITIGLGYTFLGLVLFLTGVNMGFLAAGNFLGGQIAQLTYNWLLIPIAMLIGYYIVAAEPAVHVLTKQVEEITDGAISAKSMRLSLSIGVAISLGLAMIRVLTGLSLWWFIAPGYGIALLLTFVTPQIFTAVAFDSGGVASGPMTATFVLPFAMGASAAVGGDIIVDAFGVVAMVAMTPLITIQILGLHFRIQQHQAEKRKLAELIAPADMVAYTSNIDIVEWR